MDVCWDKVNLPKGWYIEAEDHYVRVHDSNIGSVVFWRHDWDVIHKAESYLARTFKDRCNSSRLMYYTNENGYVALPEEVKTLQEAVDFVNVLIRMGET